MEKEINSTISDDQKFCFQILPHVSRSFAIVIDKLDEPLRTTVCVFYLILRALDTIEDDTTMTESMKLESLKIFPTFFDQLTSPLGVDMAFNCRNSNKRYMELMENFDKVLAVFGKCTTDADKKIIREVVIEMSDGMIKYSNRSIETMAEYNEYCYYVAGIVGVGLTKLMQPNCSIDDMVRENELKRLAISTGLLLQKTNIIRDIYEDINQPIERVFYPTEVWSKYVENVRDLLDENYRPQAIACLNFLINDAFQHLPDSIQYLTSVSRTNTFRFAAIPLCMAVGTLEKMFNNPAVFNSNVKLASEECAYIMENVSDMATCLKAMQPYLSELSTRVDSLNPFNETKNWIAESLRFVQSYNV